jgi:hypothetical protein
MRRHSWVHFIDSDTLLLGDSLKTLTDILFSVKSIQLFLQYNMNSAHFCHTSGLPLSTFVVIRMQVTILYRPTTAVASPLTVPTVFKFFENRGHGSECHSIHVYMYICMCFLCRVYVLPSSCRPCRGPLTCPIAL